MCTPQSLPRTCLMSSLGSGSTETSPVSSPPSPPTTSGSGTGTTCRKCSCDGGECEEWVGWSAADGTGTHNRQGRRAGQDESLAARHHDSPLWGVCATNPGTEPARRPSARHRTTRPTRPAVPPAHQPQAHLVTLPVNVVDRPVQHAIRRLRASNHGRRREPNQPGSGPVEARHPEVTPLAHRAGTSHPRRQASTPHAHQSRRPPGAGPAWEWTWPSRYLGRLGGKMYERVFLLFWL